MSRTDTLPDLLGALLQPTALKELAVLVACLGMAWGLSWLGSRRSARLNQRSLWFGSRGYDGLWFPIWALCLVLLARWAAQSLVPIAVLRLAVPILFSLALIRITVRMLDLALPASPTMRTLQRSVSWLVWIGVILWVTDLLPLMLHELESMHWRVGGSDVSVRSLIEGALTAIAVLVLMLWFSALIEARLLATRGVDLSVRKIAANATRALLILVGLLLALSAAGIPLTALSVLGGAAGVGIGLGLQRLAANYVSGFVILAERSLRIGDVVKVDNFEGRITDINSRYTVIRNVNGRESIVPNEMLVSQRVENCSFADPKVALTSMVQVAYGTDLPALSPRLVACIALVPRVLSEPGPAVQLSNFAPDGLELTLVFWICDPENGQGNIRSEVNLAVLKLLTESGIEIPYPQRVVHARAG